MYECLVGQWNRKNSSSNNKRKTSSGCAHTTVFLPRLGSIVCACRSLSLLSLLPLSLSLLSLSGYPPFYAEDPMSTCRKIVNWKKTLVFPDEAKLSPDARDLIQRMVCDSSKRLTFEQLKTHRFFSTLDWNGVRKTRAPIVPAVTNELDTQNFDKFEVSRKRKQNKKNQHSKAVGSSLKGHTGQKN